MKPYQILHPDRHALEIVRHQDIQGVATDAYLCLRCGSIFHTTDECHAMSCREVCERGGKR